MKTKTRVRAGAFQFEPQRDAGTRFREGQGAQGEDTRQGWWSSREPQRDPGAGHRQGPKG